VAVQQGPLAIASDDGVLEELRRAAAAAGVELAVRRALGPLGSWRTAPLVLVDVVDVAALASARPPRRDRVVVVAASEIGAEQWQACVELGAEQVLRLGERDDELVRLLAESAGSDALPGSGDGLALAVIGACGGAGASVFAAATAIAAQRSGRPVLLAVTDPWGPGIDVVLGVEATGGVRWSDIAAPSGRLPAAALHRALPSVRVAGGHMSVLCHSRYGDREVDPELLDTVLDAARRAGDVAVLDLPRAPFRAADRAVERAELTVLVVPADVRGCYGAARLAPRLTDLGARMGLVVRGPSPGGLGADDIAATLEIPLLARMRPEPGLDRRMDGGKPPGCNPKGPLGRAAATVLIRAGVAV
jgi:secretion/DNA translocation related CpaE-like protein